MITGWYPSLLEPGNGDFVQKQVRLLRQYGVRVDLIYADLNIAYLRKGQLLQRRSIVVDHQGNQDVIISGPIWPKNNVLGFRNWINRFTKLVQDFISIKGYPEVIHGQTYLGGIVANRVKASLDIPLIITEHFTGWITGDIRSSHKRLAIQAFEHADMVTTVSSALAKHIQPYLTKEIHVIPNFIDTRTFKPKKKPFSKKLKMIYIGELIARKQVNHAILLLHSILNKHREAQLTILGTGPLEAELKSLASQLQVAHAIKWLGRVNSEEVAQQLQAHDILVHPSILETFGLTIAEALCSGVPVITYPNLGINEMKDLPGIIVLSSFEYESMISAILDNISSLSRLRPTEIATPAQKRFGNTHVIPQLLDLYQELITG